MVSVSIGEVKKNEKRGQSGCGRKKRVIVTGVPKRSNVFSKMGKVKGINN